MQPEAFSFIRHASSDLGATTADHAWIANQLGGNLPGMLLFVFALGLRRSVGPHRSARIGTALVAAAGVLIFLSAFLRLDCRQIDPGCEITSWHATLHGVNSGLTFLAVLLAPFVLARTFRLAPGWDDLRPLSIAAGVATIVGLFAGSLGGEGLGQLLGIGVWFGWIAVLALRLNRRERAHAEGRRRRAAPWPRAEVARPGATGCRAGPARARWPRTGP